MESIQLLERDYVMIFAACLMLPACGAESPAPGASPESEDVATVDQALFESTCWTQASADVVHTDPANGGAFAALSPNAAYDHPDCRHQWIVEVSNIFGKRVWASVTSPTLETLNQDWCPFYWDRFVVVGWRLNLCPTGPCGGQWEMIGEGDLGMGSWSHSGGYCYDPFGRLVSLSGNHLYTKLRVIGQAGWANALLPVNTQVLTAAY